MGKISQEERREGYCKVAGQLCENPFMYVEKTAKNTELGTLGHAFCTAPRKCS